MLLEIETLEKNRYFSFIPPVGRYVPKLQLMGCLFFFFLTTNRIIFEYIYSKVEKVADFFMRLWVVRRIRPRNSKTFRVFKQFSVSAGCYSPRCTLTQCATAKRLP